MPEEDPNPSKVDLHTKLIRAGGTGMGVMIWPGKDGAGFDVIDSNTINPDKPPSAQSLQPKTGLENIDPSAHAYFDYD